MGKRRFLILKPNPTRPNPSKARAPGSGAAVVTCAYTPVALDPPSGDVNCVDRVVPPLVEKPGKVKLYWPKPIVINASRVPLNVIVTKSSTPPSTSPLGVSLCEKVYVFSKGLISLLLVNDKSYSIEVIPGRKIGLFSCVKVLSKNGVSTAIFRIRPSTGSNLYALFGVSYPEGYV